jgi:hypothetical protein
MKRTIVLIFLTSLVAGAANICFAQHHPPPEQHVFGAEDENFQRPFALPRAILDVLRRDPMVKDSLEDKNIPPDQLPGSWFQASEVHLAGPDERDVIVMGHCPVCGANVAPFWVFRPARKSYELIMFGGGLALEIMRHRTNGYRDIETSMVVTQKPWSGVWRFDGKKYQLVPDGKSGAHTSQ